MTDGERTPLRVVRRALRALWPWLVYLAGAWLCAKYLNIRAQLIPERGKWWDASAQPYVLLQVRAFLAGHLALVPHPWSAGHDYNWGRGGMQSAWGLGLPILATPFHLVARWFGRPGFPDALRFFVFYGATMVFLARALDRASPDRPNGPIVGTATAGFMLVFPTFVGLLSARFLIYDQTIATGALWSLVLLAGTLSLLRSPKTGWLVFVCAAAGFSIMIRPPTAVYGFTTVGLALVIAMRARMSKGALAWGLAAFLVVFALYFIGNDLRFGTPWATGYENSLSGAFVNRMTRWGLPFAKVPFLKAAKEMFATLFLLETIPNHIMMGLPPTSVAPYVVGERWREYYAPTYDIHVFWVWVAAVVVVAVGIVRGRLWRKDRPLENEVATVVGAWALPPSLALFVFYARIGNMVTRYATDMYPALAAACLCVGIGAVALVRKRAAVLVPSVQIAIAACFVLYVDIWRGWVTQLSHPYDRKTLDAELADIDARSKGPAPAVPKAFACNEPRGPSPVHTHLEDWHPDCTFSSGMVFAMPHSPCVTFTFHPAGPSWAPADDAALADLRMTGDFDTMRLCRSDPADDPSARRVTMCEPRPPRFLLDGLRLYSVAVLDDKLEPVDRLKLMKIEATPACN